MASVFTSLITLMLRKITAQFPAYSNEMITATVLNVSSDLAMLPVPLPLLIIA